jgi:hypothetical protein
VNGDVPRGGDLPRDLPVVVHLIASGKKKGGGMAATMRSNC